MNHKEDQQVASKLSWWNIVYVAFQVVDVSCEFFKELLTLSFVMSSLGPSSTLVANT